MSWCALDRDNLSSARPSESTLRHPTASARLCRFFNGNAASTDEWRTVCNAFTLLISLSSFPTTLKRRSKPLGRGLRAAPLPMPAARPRKKSLDFVDTEPDRIR